MNRGLIALDEPVVASWPELGDDRVLIRHLLTHTAGRVTVPDVPLLDWDRSVAALAAMRPDWPPGDVVCEHALTFGHLVGEVVRRIDGRSPGRFMADEFAEPLGLDVHVGVSDADLARVADTVGLDRGEPAVTGYDRFVDDDMTWTLAGGCVDGLDIGMGGLGGQWAAARPSIGLAWAFLTTRVGDHDRAQRIEGELIAAAQTSRAD